MGNAENLIVLNALCVWLIQWAKCSKLVPFVTEESGKASRLVSIALASLASAGLVFTVSQSGNFENGGLLISWQGLTAAHVVAFLYHAAGNYATQKGLFKLYTLGTSNVTQVQPTNVVVVNPKTELPAAGTSVSPVTQTKTALN